MEMRDMRQDLKDNKIIQQSIYNILQEIGENPDRDGLKRTPYRVAKAYEEWFGGYGWSPFKVLDRLFETDYQEGAVIVKDIKFYSHCEHHMTPFFGKVHIGYIPKKKVVGLDKLIKLVEVYARRLQTQEQLTYQIADAIHSTLKPKGVAVQIQAIHFCIMSRETRNQDSITVTTKLLGDFRESAPREEFLHSIKNSSIW